MKSNTYRFVAVFAPILFSAGPSALAVTTGNWNYDGSTAASNSWNTAGSWTGGMPNGVGDSAALSLNITAARAITLDGDKTLGTLTIGDPTTSYFGYTLSTGSPAGRLIFDQTGVANATMSLPVAATTATNTISAPVLLNDNLVISSAITSTSVNALTMSGIIDDGSGSFSITKNNTFLMTLSGANTYKGGTTINAGKITASNAASFGAGLVTVASGGQANLTATAANASNFSLTGTGFTEAAGNLGALRYGTTSGNITTTGTITVAGSARIGVSTGAIGNMNGTLSGSAALELNSSAASQAGTLMINGSASGYTGTLTATQGTLKLESTSNLGGSLIVADTAKLYANNISGNGNAAVISGNLTLGSSTGASLYVDPSTTNVLSVGGNLALVGNNTVNLTSVYPGTSVPVLKYSGSVTAGTVAANLVLPGGIATYRSGTGISTTGSGPYTVNLTLNPGSVTWTPGVTTGNWDTSATNWTEGGTTGKVYFNGDNVTFAEPSAAATVTIASGVTVAPTSIAFTNTSNSYTLAGSGVIAGAPTISKSGAGRLNLTSTVGITGGGIFNISGGTVTSANTTAVGLSVNANLSGTITLGDTTTYGALTFTGTHSIANGANITTPVNSHVLLSGPVSLPAAFTVNAPFVTSTNGYLIASGTATMNSDTVITTPSAFNSSNYLGLSGVLTDGAGTYKLSKEGVGCLRLQLANTYKGGTLIDSGLIVSVNAAGLGTGDVTINGNMTSGGQVEYTNGGTVPNNFKISGTGLPLSGDTGGDGAIQINFGPTTLTGSITLNGNSRITGYLSYAGILNGNITENGGQYSLDIGSPGAVNGCGTITLAGTNSYTGGTNIYRTIARGWSNSAFGTGGVTIGGDASATLTTRVEIGSNANLSNNFSLSSVGKTDSTVNYGEITSYPGDATTLSTAVVNGTVNITATPANGGHFATQGNAANVLRVSGAINSSVPVIVAAGIVELGGGGTGYTALTQAKDTLRVAATNGIATTAIVTQGTTGAAVLDLNGFSQSLVALVKSTNAASVTNNGLSPATLTLAPADGLTHAYAGTFAGGSSALNLAIGGDGTSVTSLTVSSASFAGTTTVGNGGILNLPSGVTLGNSSSAATCGNGGKLTGLGTFGGSLSLTNGAKIDIDPSLGHLNVTGNLTVTGTVTVNLLSTPGPSITVLGCSGALRANAGNFVLANAGSYNSPHFAVVGNSLVLTTGALSLTWTGSGGSNWMVNGNASWTDGTNTRSFLNGDSAAFTDGPSSNQTIYLPGAVQPNAVSFNNSTRSYTFIDSGSASLQATSLTKSGSNTVTLGVPFTVSGTTTLNAGNLVIQTPDFGSTPMVVGNTIAGAGTLTLSAGLSNPVTLSGANSGYTGSLVVSKADLILSSSAASGTGTITLGDANTQPFDYPELTLGVGVSISNSVVVNSFDNTLIDGAGSITGAATLIKRGDGSLIVSNVHTFTGATTVVAGTLSCTVANGIASASTITLGAPDTGVSDTTLALPSTMATPLVLSSAATSHAILTRSGGSVATLSGTVALNGRDLWLQSPSITLSGAISGAGNLCINNSAFSSPVIISGESNSFVGDVVVLGGSVQTSTLGGTHNCIPDSSSVILSAGTTFYVGASDAINALTGPADASVRPSISSDGTVELSVGAANGSGTFGGVLANQSGTRKLAFTKLGTGTETLTGNSTATGDLHASGGTLLVDGNYPTHFFVDAGAVLGGNGTVGAGDLGAGSRSISGYLAPGDGIGTLTLRDAVNLGSGAGLDLQIGNWTGTTPGVDYDTLVTAGLDFFGPITVNLDCTGLTNFSETAQTFVIATAPTTIYPPGYNATTLNVTNFPGKGTWTLYNPDNRSDFGTSLKLYYTPPSYKAWVNIYPTLYGATALPGADPDHDGIPNLMEYVLGGIPTVGSEAILPTQALNPGGLTFTYSRASSSANDTTQVVEWTNDFVTWNEIPVGPVSADPVTIIANANAPDTVIVTIPRSSELNGLLFARLKVSSP